MVAALQSYRYIVRCVQAPQASQPPGFPGCRVPGPGSRVQGSIFWGQINCRTPDGKAQAPVVYRGSARVRLPSPIPPFPPLNGPRLTTNKTHTHPPTSFLPSFLPPPPSLLYCNIPSLLIRTNPNTRYCRTSQTTNDAAIGEQGHICTPPPRSHLPSTTSHLKSRTSCNACHLIPSFDPLNWLLMDDPRPRVASDFPL